MQRLKGRKKGDPRKWRRRDRRVRIGLRSDPEVAGRMEQPGDGQHGGCSERDVTERFGPSGQRHGQCDKECREDSAEIIQLAEDAALGNRAHRPFICGVKGTVNPKGAEVD